MPTTLKERIREIAKTISEALPMRKGSITMQMVKTTRKDGTTALCGPYPLYTCKKGGKSVSKRIPLGQVEAYRQQIQRHRRFRELVEEMSDLAEQMADEQLREGEEKKGS